MYKIIKFQDLPLFYGEEVVHQILDTTKDLIKKDLGNIFPHKICGALSFGIRVDSEYNNVYLEYNVNNAIIDIINVIIYDEIPDLVLDRINLLKGKQEL